MKTLKLNLVVLFSILTLCTSCSKDDDNDDNNDQQSSLVSTGTCGEFFDGVNLSGLCGVASTNSQAVGTDPVCTYIIREAMTAGQELYAITLWDFATVNESVDFYNLVIADPAPGATVTIINGVGDEAVYVDDQDNTDFSIIFRIKNVTGVVATDELLFELGCSNPQARLKEVIALINANFQ